MKSIYFAEQNVHVVLNEGVSIDVVTLAAALRRLDFFWLVPGDPCYLGHRPKALAGGSVNEHYRETHGIPADLVIPEAWYYCQPNDVVYSTARRNAYRPYKAGDFSDYWRERVYGAIDGAVKNELIGYIYRPLLDVKPSYVRMDFERINTHMRSMIEALLAKGVVTFTGNMGSCQCGDTHAKLSVTPTGLLWVKTTGSESWQCYDGPAAFCDVPYGVGAKASLASDCWVGSKVKDASVVAAYC